MLKKIFLLCTLLIGSLFSMESVKENKKKILVINGKGGGAHLSASAAIEAYYKDDYEIESVGILEDVLSNTDICKKLTLGKFDFQDLYNYALKNRFNSAINFFAPKFKNYLKLFSNESIKNNINRFLSQKKIDLVISVFPLFNKQILSSCKELNIPMILVTVDYDTSYWIEHLEDVDYEKFFYTIAFDDEIIKSKLESLYLKDFDQLKVIGYHIRPDFFQSKNKDLIKKNFSLPDNKKIITIIMGATGSDALIKYLKEICKSDLELHLILCIGRSNDLVENIKGIILPSNITISIIGYISNISDLIYISDLIITKSGPTTIAEALYLNKPVLVDCTIEPVLWEKLNPEFIEKNHLGLVIKNIEQIKFALPIILKPDYYNTILENISKLEKKDARKELKLLIDKLLFDAKKSDI